MKAYTCKAADSRGTVVRFLRQGTSVQSVRTVLQEEGFFPISITLKTGWGFCASSRITKGTLLEFTGLLSALLTSGLSVKDALDIVKTVTKDVKVTTLASRTVRDMEAGYSLFVSIRRLGSSLPPVYTSMVQAGETTGDFPSIFKKLYKYLLRQKRIHEKLTGSLLYPLIVLSTALLSLVLVSAFIIPRIGSLFSGFGTQIPESIQRTLSLSNGIVAVCSISVPLIILLRISLPRIRKKSKTLDMLITRLTIKIPVAGPFIRDTMLVHILFIMDALTASGVTVEDTLHEITRTSGTILYQEIFNRLHNKVLKGINLSDALYQEKILPKRISRWVAIGEKTGDVEKVIGQLASYYENELEKKSARLINIIEPGLILLTGILLSGLVLFIIVPLFSALGTLMG